MHGHKFVLFILDSCTLNRAHTITLANNRPIVILAAVIFVLVRASEHILKIFNDYALALSDTLKYLLVMELNGHLTKYV